jgi:hypothetical protein
MFDAWMLKASVMREPRQLDLRRACEHQALPLLRLSAPGYRIFPNPTEQCFSSATAEYADLPTEMDIESALDRQRLAYGAAEFDD